MKILRRPGPVIPDDEPGDWRMLPAPPVEPVQSLPEIWKECERIGDDWAAGKISDLEHYHYLMEVFYPALDERAAIQAEAAEAHQKRRLFTVIRK